jgi:tyrosine-protein kinase
MELRQYLSIVWKWLWLVILAVVIAAIASYLASRAATPLYRTTTTMMVGRITQDPNPNSINIYMGQQLALTYIQLVKREPVLKGAIESLGLEIPWQSLANQVSASAVPQTQLIEISVIDSDPYRSKVLADAIAQQLILQSPANPTNINQDQSAFTQQQLTDLQTKIQTTSDQVLQLRSELDQATSARQIQDLQSEINLLDSKVSGWQNTYSQMLLSLQGGDINVLNVVEEAAIPRWPFSPNIPMNVLTASAIALVLALGGAFLVEYLDDTVKNPDDVARTSNLPTLAAIARMDGDDYNDMLVTIHKPLSPTAEAFRILRTNLQFSWVDRPARSLMMSSPGPSEGKSTTLANLAIVLAQSGVKVALIDTDLRRPVQHKIFSLSNRHGLTDAIIQPDRDLKDLLQPTNVENLWLLSSGPLPPNPAELLASARLGNIIDELKNLVDLALFDSPPVLVVADAAILGPKVDGVVLVNDTGHTRSAEARRAAEELRRARANLLGIVLNRLTVGSSGYNYYYYYYHYYYQEDGKEKRPRSRWNPFDRQSSTFRQASNKTK